MIAPRRPKPGAPKGRSRGTAGTNPEDRSLELARRILELSVKAPRKALEMARRELSDRRSLDPEARARLLRASGHALRGVGDYPAARDHYLESRRLFRRLGLENEHAICALGLVDACMYLGRTREALSVAESARGIFRSRRDWQRLAKLETNVGNVYHRLDALEPALSHYDRATRYFGRAGAAAEQANVDHNRANVLTFLGRRRDAETLYRNARDVFTSMGQPVLAAQVDYGLACLRFLNGEYAAAISQLEGVRPELARLGARPLLALADLDLAEFLVAMRLYPEALALAREAGRWFKRHGVPAELARCELLAGIAMANLGRSGSAERSLGSADRLYQSQAHEPGRAAVALARGQLAWIEDRPGAAVRHGTSAAARFRRAGFQSRALASGALAAEACLKAGRHRRAGALADDWLETPRGPGDAYSRARLARVKGMAAFEAGDLKRARRCYREALREAARAHSALFVDEWRVGFLEGEPAILDEFLGLLLSGRPKARAAEIWKWISATRSDIRVRARGESAGPGLPVRLKLAELRTELEASYARLWRLEGSEARRVDPGTSRKLEQRTLRLEGQLRRLAAPGPVRPRGRRRTSRSSRLEEQELRLIYFRAGQRLAALRQDSSGEMTLIPDLGRFSEVDHLIQLFHYQMGVRGSLIPALSDYREQIAARARDHLTALGALLLDPVLDAGRPPAGVRILPYGSLFRVPFHALPWRGSPLIETCEVAIDPCIRQNTETAGKRRGAWVLGFGGAGLNAVEEEARQVAAAFAFDAVPVELRTGGFAQKEALRQAAGSALVVHVSCHAVYRAEHPEFSALRLADGWVNAGDLAGLPLDGACVVLSACETGPRGVVAGEEMLGIARGLIRAGARTVIASLWRVDDQATLAIMRNLYAGWRAAGRLGPALRAVQQRASREETDPYLWAPFCLMGDSSVPWPRARAEGARAISVASTGMLD